MRRIGTVPRGDARAVVPARWGKDIERVLIPQDRIARRIRAMSRDIQRDFTDRELVVVALLNGTVTFLADLIRQLSLPLRLDFIGVSSYGAETHSGQLVFTKELRLGVRGRDVLLVDDILDTGKTLSRVLAKLQALEPRRIRTCVLLNKAARRIENIQADYVGFEIPDLFVVGYGLDFAERYRNLPFVGVLRSEAHAAAGAGTGGVRQTADPDFRGPFVAAPNVISVTVRFYSCFKDMAGCSQTRETLPERSTLGQLLKTMAVRFPGLGPMEQSTMMAVGLDYQDRSYVLQEGDEVSLFPPVQGG
ncbi:MAG: hypoxanthine phosphoribosyltransferase [Limisphaerales bacterium]